jgi:hypothetical protein
MSVFLIPHYHDDPEVRAALVGWVLSFSPSPNHILAQLTIAEFHELAEAMLGKKTAREIVITVH